MTRLLHLSDTHLAAPGAPDAHPGIDAEDRLRRVLDAAREHGPYDAVVLTGDVCDDGSAHGAARVREVVGDLAPVVCAVPGNHDRTETVEGVFGRPDVRVGAWRITGATTNVPEQVQGDARPLAAVLRDLAPDEPSVVLHHHPVHSRSTHEWFTLEHRDEVLAVLGERTAPLVMLSGHTHEHFETRAGAITYLGAPATYYGLAHDADGWRHADEVVGALVVELGDDGAVTARLLSVPVPG